MMREIVADAVRSAPDMRLTGFYADRNLEDAVGRQRGDIVIISDASAGADRLRARLLVAHPDLTVVVMRADGSAADVFELRRRHVADPSPAGLIDAIRGVASGDGRSTQ